MVRGQGEVGIDFMGTASHDRGMNDDSKLRRCVELLTGNNLLVLATTGPEGPHTSLMAYVASEDGREVYLATARDSRKWANIQFDSRVSLLIDDRAGTLPQDRRTISALTVTGVHVPLDDGPEAEGLRARLLSRHPGLAVFLNRPDGQLIRVRVQSYLLLSGPNDAFHHCLKS